MNKAGMCWHITSGQGHSCQDWVAPQEYFIRSCPNSRNVFWDRSGFYFSLLSRKQGPACASAWYNVRADMKNKPAPLLNPGTLKPMTAKELDGVFCDELVQQELDDTTAYIPIPDEIREYYRMYRPSPLCRAYRLEEALGTPAKIYYKFEGNNTSGSHKLNSAIAQAYYAKKQGLKGVTTETGAGQWGTALSMACSYFGLDCKVYMVKVR